MNNESLYEAIGNINEKHINAAHVPTKQKKLVWIKWGVMAACLCLIIGLGIIVPSLLQEKSPELLSTGAHLEMINVELIEWQDNGFKAIVVDTGNSSLFPVDAKLTVIFRENNTEIVLDNGSSYGYGEIQIDDIGWSPGTIIDIGFGVYEKYETEKEYENKVYAYHVKAAKNIPALSEISNLLEEELNKKLVGFFNEELNIAWGEPDGHGSGSWMDYWHLDDTKSLCAYYDADGNVEIVKISDTLQ